MLARDWIKQKGVEKVTIAQTTGYTWQDWRDQPAKWETTITAADLATVTAKTLPPDKRE